MPPASFLVCCHYSQDCILHVLPLHHTHGIVNCLLVPLHVGASIVMLPKFDPDLVINHLLHEVDGIDLNVTVFMAVPTIYAKLLEALRKIGGRNEEVIEKLRSNIRLMVSGSAALPQV